MTKNIIVGGPLFASKPNDLNPSIIVDLHAKILFTLKLENSVNVNDYDVRLTFEDASVQVILVS